MRPGEQILQEEDGKDTSDSCCQRSGRYVHISGTENH